MIEDYDRQSGSRVGHVGRCSQRTWGEEPFGRFEREEVIGDESTRHFDRRVYNRTVEQVCKASPCYTKTWVHNEAKRIEERCASRKFVQAYYRGQYPPTQESQSRLMA